MPLLIPAPWYQPKPNVPLPSNVRLRGGNIVCNAFPGPSGQVWSDYGPTVWDAMWAVWDWEGWIKPQIDDLVSLGGNAVRLWGGGSLVNPAGLMTMSTYLAQWKQLLDYCASLNLYVYPTGGDWSVGTYGLLTQAQAIPVFNEWVPLLADYPNVIAVDLINEVWSAPVGGGGSYSATVEMIQALAGIVRGHGIPTAVSFSITESDWWNFDSNGTIGTYPVAPFMEASDIIDIHCYATTTNANLTATMGQTWAQGKLMLFGETDNGAVATTDPAAAAWYTTIEGLIASSSNMVGAFAWSVYDVAPSGNTFGLFSAPGTPVTNITTPFQTWPKTR